MTVEQVARLIPNGVKINLYFDCSEYEYNRGDPLHLAAFGNMVVSMVIPHDEEIAFNIRAMPERMS